MQKTNEELSISYDVTNDFDPSYDTDDYVVCPAVTITRKKKSNMKKKKAVVGAEAKK